MAESSSPPPGFGELEVLAVGMVLLVEGERAEFGVVWGPRGSQNLGHSYDAGKERPPSPTPLNSDPRGLLLGRQAAG